MSSSPPFPVSVKTTSQQAKNKELPFLLSHVLQQHVSPSASCAMLPVQTTPSLRWAAVKDLPISPSDRPFGSVPIIFPSTLQLSEPVYVWGHYVPTSVGDVSPSPLGSTSTSPPS